MGYKPRKLMGAKDIKGNEVYGKGLLRIDVYESLHKRR